MSKKPALLKLRSLTSFRRLPRTNESSRFALVFFYFFFILPFRCYILTSRPSLKAMSLEQQIEAVSLSVDGQDSIMQEMIFSAPHPTPLLPLQRPFTEILQQAYHLGSQKGFKKAGQDPTHSNAPTLHHPSVSQKLSETPEYPETKNSESERVKNRLVSARMEI